jgi:hypothetical protein
MDYVGWYFNHIAECMSEGMCLLHLCCSTSNMYSSDRLRDNLYSLMINMHQIHSQCVYANLFLLCDTTTTKLCVCVCLCVFVCVCVYQSVYQRMYTSTCHVAHSTLSRRYYPALDSQEEEEEEEEEGEGEEVVCMYVYI